MVTVQIKPGTPNDANRDYLPEGILGTDMVVNENGNNSQPIPDNLMKYHEVLADGYEGTWYEYIPSTYDASRKTPLVISCHGGLMTGWGQCVYSSWVQVAEREGLIVVYPDGHCNRFWAMVTMRGRHAPQSVGGLRIPKDVPSPEDNYDLCFLNRLIDRIEEKYNVDKTRIFMQGMSNGSGITQQFARYYGHRLAGACISAGAHNLMLYTNDQDELVNRGGPLDIILACPENNDLLAECLPRNSRTCREAAFYWMQVNGITNRIPQIAIHGEDNFAYYTGGKANVTLLDVKNRDHGQAFDEASVCWDHVFSGSRREGDKVIHGSTWAEHSSDRFAAAFMEGIAKVWWHNEIAELKAPPRKWQVLKYHGLDGGHIIRGEYLMVPLSFLAKLAGAEYSSRDANASVVLLLPDGRRLQFARGSIGCVIDQSVRSMLCEAIQRDGELMVSVEWFAQYILNLHVSQCNGVVYVTDHFVQLSYTMADVIRDLLSGEYASETFQQDSLAIWKQTHGGV